MTTVGRRAARVAGVLACRRGRGSSDAGRERSGRRAEAGWPSGRRRAVSRQQAPRPPASSVLGDQSRFVFEIGDEALRSSTSVQIVNGAPTPVQPAAPFVFDLPGGRPGCGVLQGSSPQATAGRPSGCRSVRARATLVQFAYTHAVLPATRDDRAEVCRWRSPSVTVLAQKVGEMRLASPQMAQHREMTAEATLLSSGRGPASQPAARSPSTSAGCRMRRSGRETWRSDSHVAILVRGRWRAAAAEHARAGRRAPPRARRAREQRRELARSNRR